MVNRAEETRDGWWIAPLLATLLFAGVEALFVSPRTTPYWLLLIAAAAAIFIPRFLARSASDGVARTSDAPVDLLHKITAGDLTFTDREISSAAGAPEMASAVRALLLSLERTIRRFSQLATDVNAVSEQVSNRSRNLARSAATQLRSTEATTASVSQIDQSINAVQKSIEDLSLNAEETSASILQMAASIEEVGRIADTLSEFVEQTAAAIEEMIASIQEVATNTEGFSSFAVQTATTMVEMNSITAEIGRSARNSTELARLVEGSATEGRDAVLGTVEGMQKIKASVEEAQSSLNMLGERSEEIGEIVRVIDDIARQTNLLALNAAIIAAQAGDRGRGFAVVADEIRDLSERTSVSTDEIRTIIQNVQRGVERAAGQMTLSTERVSEGVQLTARAQGLLDKILELTERSRESISEIAKATEEQGRGSQAATAAIEEVTRMVQQTAAATQQQSQTSTTIGEQASRVRDYTKHLKRAMDEQASGSRSISRAMENIMSNVATVAESTAVLASESAAIVTSMEAIQQGTRESNFSVSDLNQMAGTLRHESSLLSQELQKFRLPSAEAGGKLTTAVVLPTRLTFDPAFCQFMALGYLNKPVHENLVQFGEGAELMPGLAASWEVLEQGTLYRFHLRPNAQFHNGRPITAADVRDSFLRLMSPELDSPGQWILRDIAGAEDVIEGRSRDCKGLKLVDDHTIEVTLREPLAFFLLLLSLPEAGILPVEETKNDAFRFKPVGAGPFQVEEAREGEIVRLRRNRRYYLPDTPHLDELTFRLDLKTSKDVADAFLRGELDLASGIPLKTAHELRNDQRFAPFLLDTVQMHTSYVSFDSSTAPFNDRAVRQAVSYAINRQRINDRIFSGLGVIAQSVLPPGLLGYDPGLRGYTYDPDRAKSLLRQAGHANGFKMEYWTWDTDEFYNSGQIPMIIEDLAAIGIDVEVSQHSVAEAREHIKTPGHNSLFAGNWYADFPDADNFFYMFFHTESRSIWGMNYKSGEIDAKINEARRTNDIEQRTKIYHDLNRMSMEEAPMVYLFHDRFFLAHKPEVRGVRTYLVPPPVRFHDVWIER